MPRELPRFQILEGRQHAGEFFWDSRLSQIRKVDNPHRYEDIAPGLAVCLDDLEPGQSYRHPEFDVRYRRIS